MCYQCVTQTFDDLVVTQSDHFRDGGANSTKHIILKPTLKRNDCQVRLLIEFC